MSRRPGLPDYDRPERFPPLVWEAVELTRRLDFPLACTPEVGRLLQVLAGRGRAGELGTGCGVGSAWLLSGMAPGQELVTVELDPKRAQAAAALLAPRGVTVLSGSWEALRAHAPFDLVFADGGPKHEPEAPELIAELLAPRGLVVLDDFTPGRTVVDDPTRRNWLESPHYRAAEIQVAHDMAVLLAALL